MLKDVKTPLNCNWLHKQYRVSHKTKTMASFSSSIAHPLADNNPSLSLPSSPQRKLTGPSSIDSASHGNQVDSFLSGPSHRTPLDEPGPLPLLKPTPLPESLMGFSLLQALVQRRAWSDVIVLSSQLLNGGSPVLVGLSDLMDESVDPVMKETLVQGGEAAGSVLESALRFYKMYYTQWIDENTASSTNDRIGANNVDEKYLSEVLLIVHWRLRAFLFQRKYRELKMEVIRLKLFPSNSSTRPHWVPLSLVLEGMASMVHAIGIESEENEQYGFDNIVDEFYTLRTTLCDKSDLFQLDVVLSNLLMQREEWRLALMTLDNMLEYAQDAVVAWMEKKKSTDKNQVQGSAEMLTKAIQIDIYSRQGKILLQTGCLPAAATVFERAHATYLSMNPEETDFDGAKYTLLGGSSDIILVQNVPTQILINEGLLHFAHVDYDLAEQKFKKAIEQQRLKERRGMGRISRRFLLSDALMNSEDDLLVSCTNNLALCALYTCRMREAVSILESLIRENPTEYLTDCLVFNLCTLYELGHDNATSEKRKKILQSIAIRFTLHDIGIENFRLTDDR
jgi:hypothetical protein